MKESIPHNGDQDVLVLTEEGNKHRSIYREFPHSIKVDIPGQGLSGLLSRVKEHNEFHKKGELAVAQQVIDHAVNPTAVKSAIVIERSIIVAGKVGARMWARAKKLVAKWREQEPLFVTDEGVDEVGSCELRLPPSSREGWGTSVFCRFFRKINPFRKEEAEDTSYNPFAHLSQDRRRASEPNYKSEPDYESEPESGLVSI